MAIRIAFEMQVRIDTFINAFAYYNPRAGRVSTTKAMNVRGGQFIAISSASLVGNVRVWMSSIQRCRLERRQWR